MSFVDTITFEQCPCDFTFPWSEARSSVQQLWSNKFIWDDLSRFPKYQWSVLFMSVQVWGTRPLTSRQLKQREKRLHLNYKDVAARAFAISSAKGTDMCYIYLFTASDPVDRVTMVNYDCLWNSLRPPDTHQDVSQHPAVDQDEADSQSFEFHFII